MFLADALTVLSDTTASSTIDTVVRSADLIGVLANAVLGGVLARAWRFDLVGFATLAIMSGLGGGIIRDVLLQQGPPVALTDEAYLVTALVGAAIAYVIPVGGDAFHRAFPYVDAVALGTWAAVGAQKALGAELGWLPAIMLGTITAVGGGALRDVVLRQTPAVFGGNTLYATSAIVASAVLVGLDRIGAGPWGLVVAAASGLVLTVVASWRGWSLPEPPERRWVRPRLGPWRRSRS